jgi:hypothetical protein
MQAKKILKGSDVTKFIDRIAADPDVWFEIWDEDRGYARETACIDMQYEQTMDGKHRLILKETICRQQQPLNRHATHGL